jgi:hypothetical protein
MFGSSASCWTAASTTKDLPPRGARSSSTPTLHVARVDERALGPLLLDDRLAGLASVCLAQNCLSRTPHKSLATGGLGHASSGNGSQTYAAFSRNHSSSISRVKRMCRPMRRHGRRLVRTAS